MIKHIRVFAIFALALVTMIIFQNCGKAPSAARPGAGEASLGSLSDSSSGSQPSVSPPDALPPSDSSTAPAVSQPAINPPPVVIPATVPDPMPIAESPAPGPVTVADSSPSGSAGSTDTVSNTINGPPIFPLNALTDKAFYIGDSLTLNVPRATYRILKYQWYKDGVAIPLAVGITFNKVNAGYADAGVYRLEATNSYGTASVSANVSVLAPVLPTFVNTNYNVNSSVYEGDSRNFLAKAIGGEIKYRWFKNETPLLQTTEAYTLIATSSVNDSGQYRVEAYNSVGTASRTSNVTVMPMVAPVFYRLSLVASYPVSQGFFLSSSGAYGGGIKYRWYKDNVLLANQTSPSFAKSSLTLADYGTYKIEAYNAVGSAFESIVVPSSTP